MNEGLPPDFRKRLTRLIGAALAGRWLHILAKGRAARAAAARAPRGPRMKKGPSGKQ